MHPHSSSSSDEYSDITMSVSRSSMSDISVMELVNFLKDVQRFLDKLNHEDISDDCQEIKYSLGCRIDFYTKRSTDGWISKVSQNRNSFDLPQTHLNRDRLYSSSTLTRNNRRVSVSSETSRKSSKPPDLQPPPLTYRQLENSMMSMDLSQEESSYTTDTNTDTFDTSNTDSEDYSTARAGQESFHDFIPPPTKTSTPKKLRNSGILAQMDHSNAQDRIEEEDFECEDDYDLVEIRSETHPAIMETETSPLDLSARSLIEISDHKGWLWKKESIFKSVRYWALIHAGNLYLYSDVKDEVYKECYYLEGAHLKRHKKGVKFLVQVRGTYKNKNSKQEYQTESQAQTDVWMRHLETAIVNAGRTPKTTKKLSLNSSQDPSFSSTQDFLDVEEEDYDVVEVKTIPKSPKRHSINNDKDVDKSVYDVPRPKMSRMIRKSQSTFNLNLRTSEEKPTFKRQPPLPSPRKVYLSESQDRAPPLPEKTPADVCKRLFIDDHCSAENEVQQKVSPQFSSKTLKPMKKKMHNDSMRFRQRNNSESDKHPEEVYNELAAILQRRRQNLENQDEQHNKLTSDPCDEIPPYSQVNKVAKLKKFCQTSQSSNQRLNEAKPRPSFLHTSKFSSIHKYTDDGESQSRK